MQSAKSSTTMGERDFPGLSKILQQKRAEQTAQYAAQLAQQQEAERQLEARRAEYQALREHPVVTVFQEAGGLLAPFFDDVSLGIVNPDRSSSDTPITVSLIREVKPWGEAYGNREFHKWQEANCALERDAEGIVIGVRFNIDRESDRRDSVVLGNDPKALRRGVDQAITRSFERESSRNNEPDDPLSPNTYKDEIPLISPRT